MAVDQQVLGYVLAALVSGAWLGVVAVLTEIWRKR